MIKQADKILVKIQSIFAIIALLPRALRLVWAPARRWTIAWLAFLIIQGILPAVTVIVSKLLVDSLVVLVETAGTEATILPAFGYAVLFGILMILSQGISRASEWIRSIQGELVREHVTALVHRQSAALDLVFYDSPDYYNHLYRARAQASLRPVSLLENLGGVLQNAITVTSLTIVLLRYGFWVPFFLIVGSLPVLYVLIRYNRFQHDWYLRTTSEQRQAWYYDWLLTTRESASELRLFKLSDHFIAAYQTVRSRLRDERLTLAKKRGLAELGAGLVALMFTAAAMIWMVRQVLLGLATLGDLALFYQAFNQGQNAVRSLMHNVGQLYVNSLFLRHFFEFLELKPTIKEPARPLPVLASISEGISFSDVVFYYPGRSQAALRNLDLFIPAGKITAIVGSNSSGKTTALKILTRLYDPHSGKVTIDGIDIRKFSIREYQQQITAIFQEPMAYQEIYKVNIALSDLDGRVDIDAVCAASLIAGADEIAARLPRGYDSQLGNWFEGGTEISPGEWQRVALARAFYRDAPIIVLDEPTSDMDPWAEMEFVKRLRELAEGRTVLIVSHRVSTARVAELIYVMDAGRVVESGSHADLVHLNSRYAASWQEQLNRQPSFSLIPNN